VVLQKREAALSFQPIRDFIQRSNVNAYLERVKARAQSVLIKPSAKALKQIVRLLERACDSNIKYCSVLKRQGLSSMTSLIIRDVKVLTKKSIENMPSMISISAPKWARDLMTRTRQNVIDFVEKNADLKQLIEHVLEWLRALEREVKEHVPTEDLKRVTSRLVSDSTSLLVSPSQWLNNSSSRVLVYDPSRGEFELELFAPTEVTRHVERLRMSFSRQSSAFQKVKQSLIQIWNKHVLRNKSKFF